MQQFDPCHRETGNSSRSIVYREQNSFKSIALCSQRLQICDLSMVDAVLLCTYQNLENGVEHSQRQLNVKMECVGAAINELFIDRPDMYRDADGFQSILIDIITSGSLKRQTAPVSNRRRS